MHREESLSLLRDRLFALLRQQSFIRGQVVLASGKTSEYYLDARLTSLCAEGAYCIARLILARIADSTITAVGGLTLGADPIIGATIALSHACHKPLQGFIVRKEAKKHGQQRLVEGPALAAGANVLIVDDVVTTGGSTVQAIRAAQDAGAVVRQVIAIVDRQEGGAAAVAACGARLESLFTIQEFLAS